MKYKNVSEETLTIPQIGVVEPGGIVETPFSILNSNFVPVDDRDEDNE